MALDYWLFAGKNGLKGVASTTRTEPDGRVVTVKDPVNPAIIKDENILYALRTSRIARAEFNQLFPLLLPEEQARLTELIELNPRISSLISNPQDIFDAMQKAQVTSGVDPNRATATRPSQIASIEHNKLPGGGG